MCGCLETEQRIHLPNLQILSNMRIFANMPITHPICQVGVKTLNLPIQHSSSWREGHQVPNMVNLRVLGDTSSFSGLCQIMMEVFHFKTYTSTAHDSLHHILPTLSFWWLRWFICLSRIWFFYFCFFRRDGMLLYLVVGCYFERSLVRKSEMFCHQFYLGQWVFPWWVGIKGGGKVGWWMAELTEVHINTGSVIEVGC